jgi:hypothetical protein
MSEVKNPLASKTVWGVIIMFLPTLLGFFGYDLDASKIAVLNESYDTIAAFVGGALALYGRFTAKTSLGLSS